MIKTIETRNTKVIAMNGMYSIEGIVKESGRFNNKHAEYRFWFDGKSELPRLTIRVRRTFHKRFSTNNQRVSMFTDCTINPTDSETLLKVIMEHVGISHDIEWEKEYMESKND